MTKYRLKKDLPTFKAGEEFILDRNGDLYCLAENIMAYYHETLEKFPNILAEWFEEIPEKPKTVWDLEDGDECYCLNSGCNLLYPAKILWSNDYMEDRSIGDIFLTAEQCEKELARRKAKQILLRDTKGFKPNWSDDEPEKWMVHYDHYYKRLETSIWTCQQRQLIYFATSEDAEASIKTHEKEWKIYLGVEE